MKHKVATHDYGTRHGCSCSSVPGKKGFSDNLEIKFPYSSIKTYIVTPH